jgi:4-amino-4-deoxy-L-arabinose transferase-like glycosyltransferase
MTLTLQPDKIFSSKTFMLALVLLAFALRLLALSDVPPGWRDDELINIYALSGELFEGRFPLYFSGASGHEPLYHYLQAGVNALAGYHVLSGHVLSVFLGTLSVPLTFVLVRRLFGAGPATLTALALATSFWSLMYSRIGLRHVSLPAFVLLIFYLAWLPLMARRGRPALKRWALPLGLALGLSLYTYPAARVLPFVLLSFGVYLALLHRERFYVVWRGYALALGVAALLALPLALAIRQGQSEAATKGIGADARLVELAQPVRALRAGDPGPLLENLWGTLGMFHATGDPESLYNIPHRPLFNLLGGGLFWAGVLLCLYRWRKPRYFFLLLWLGSGLAPTVLSVPPASLSHSIMIQSLAMLLPVLGLIEGLKMLKVTAGGRLIWRRWAARCKLVSQAPMWTLALLLFVVPMAWRDLRDYFYRWPQDSFVRFLYRADYRDAARYIQAQPETVEWAVSSLLMGPWDRLALEVDLGGDEFAVRLFDPQRALLYPYAGDSGLGAVLLTAYPPPASPLRPFLDQGRRLSDPPLTRYALTLPAPFDQGQPLGRFDNGLELTAVAWDNQAPPAPGQEAVLLTYWTLAAPLQHPPLPIVANPPPPGAYTGPRLAVFVHLLAADGTFLTGDDALGVDPLTLKTGDRFLQIHRLTLAPDVLGAPVLAIGLYDPYTEERWAVEGAAAAPESNRLIIPVKGVSDMP